ncbi:acriflavin resistance protein [Aureibacter tunicatorum]|nr:acriflavin resistance protein [Aureibacter tunicatorum]
MSIFSCDSKEKQTVPSSNKEFKTFKLEKKKIEKTLQLPVEIFPQDEAIISPKVEGYIKDLRVDIGDFVKKGQILLILDAPEIIANYAEAQAKRNEAQAVYAASKDNFDRLTKASKMNGIISNADLIQAQKHMEASLSALTSASSAVNSFAQLKEYLVIRAPFDGQISKRFINIGDFVSTNSKSKLFHLMDMSTSRVHLYMPESYVNFHLQDSILRFETDAIHNKVFEAKLKRKSGEIDFDTRTELWEFEHINSSNKLKAGMYATGELNISRSGLSFVVPKTAIVTAMEDQFLISIQNGIANRISVKKGLIQGDSIEVFGNLNERDQILFRGSEEITHGQKIN